MGRSFGQRRGGHRHQQSDRFLHAGRPHRLSRATTSSPPYNNAATAPASASLQNDYLRANGVYLPGQSGTLGSAQSFIAPTPAGADAAWAALSTNGVTPSTSWGYNDYNVYTKTFSATTYLVGSGTRVDITGRSILPLAGGARAYPLVGTSYLLAYSCYGDGADGVAAATRVTNLKAFLNWYYTNTQSRNIVANNGFHVLASGWVSNIQWEYLGIGNIEAITAYDFFAPYDGCDFSIVTTGTGAH